MYSTSVVANNVVLCGGRRVDGSAARGRDHTHREAPPTPSADQADAGDPIDDDGDIPF